MAALQADTSAKMPDTSDRYLAKQVGLQRSSPDDECQARRGSAMPGERIRFAIIGLDHNHVYNHARILLNAGAELVTYYSGKPDLVAEFAQTYPDVPVAPSMDAILEDPSIQVIAAPRCRPTGPASRSRRCSTARTS